MQATPRDSKAETTNPEGAIERAIAFLRAGLCRLGISQEDWSRQEVEWQLLQEFCRDSQLVLPVDFPPSEREGGREHDVRFEELPASSGRWWKYTKLQSAGYTVEWNRDGSPFMLNGSPLSYLQRIQWQNELLADDVRFIGLWPASPHQWRIITTQPDVSYRHPEESEIESLMENIGCQLLPWIGIGYAESRAFSLGEYALWDVRSANLTVDDQTGLAYPFDVIITKLPPVFAPTPSIFH